MNFQRFLSICILTAGFSIDIVNGRPNDLFPRILIGTGSTIEEHPYKVQIIQSFANTESLVCGGSILNKNTVLSAAHCVNRLSVGVKVGTANSCEDGMYMTVTSIFLHDDYKMISANGAMILYNDIAVLKLEEDLVFSDTVQPINLQPKDSPVSAGTLATIPGWGIWPGDLQETVMPIVSNEECNKIYNKSSFEITDDILCTIPHGKIILSRDSGSPLVVNKTLIGVVSMSISYAHPEYPDLYANISHLNDFITKYL